MGTCQLCLAPTNSNCQVGKVCERQATLPQNKRCPFGVRMKGPRSTVSVLEWDAVVFSESMCAIVHQLCIMLNTGLSRFRYIIHAVDENSTFGNASN
jgi:hypothetical protein